MPAIHTRPAPAPLTLLNWKRSLLSLSLAGTCPGLRNLLIVLCSPLGKAGNS